MKVDFGLKIKPLVKSRFPKSRLYSKSKKLANMNWKQTNKRFPGLNPMGDLDFDGTRNKYDCKPLDPSRDGIFEKIKEVARKVQKKRVEIRQESRETLRESPGTTIHKAIRKYTTGPRAIVQRTKKKTQYVLPGGIVYRVRKTTKGKKTIKGKKSIGAGRPKQSYKKRVHPITGQLMPPMGAVQWYGVKKKILRQARMRQEAVASRSQIMQARQLARKGIGPSMAQEIVERRIEAQMPQEPQQTIDTAEESPQEAPMEAEEGPYPTSQAPQQDLEYPTQQIQYQGQQPVQMQPRFKVVTDIMTGRKIIKPIPPREKWSE